MCCLHSSPANNAAEGCLYEMAVGSLENKQSFFASKLAAWNKRVVKRVLHRRSATWPFSKENSHMAVQWDCEKATFSKVEQTGVYISLYMHHFGVWLMMPAFFNFAVVKHQRIELEMTLSLFAQRSIHCEFGWWLSAKVAFSMRCDFLSWRWLSKESLRRQSHQAFR